MPSTTSPLTTHQKIGYAFALLATLIIFLLAGYAIWRIKALDHRGRGNRFVPLHHRASKKSGFVRPKSIELELNPKHQAEFDAKLAETMIPIQYHPAHGYEDGEEVRQEV